MLGRILVGHARHRIRQLKRRGETPARVQERLLSRLVRRARGTRFGRDHDFGSIASASDYRRAVPLQDYASLLPYFERARDKSANETWPGVPACFAMTSGTTGGNKFFPRSKESLRSTLLGGRDALAAYLARSRDSRLLFHGKIAVLGGTTALHRFESGMEWGDLTGILSGAAPRWTRWFRAPGDRVLAVPGWEERLKAAAEELAETDVRVLLGLPSWSLLLLDAVEREKDRPIREIWPSWRGFVHGGMSFSPYAELFRRRAGEGLVFVDTYSSTEGGMMAVQDRNDDPSLAVIPDRGTYFEFVPEEDLARPDPRRLGLHEIEADRPYAVAVTTDAGIWSYLIGDLVRFVETAPPRLHFAGRVKFFLNAFGEHVSQEELEAAIAAAAAAERIEVREFTVLPEYPRPGSSSGRHVWILECVEPPHDLDAFARRLDGLLCRGNDDYRSHRGSQLRPPAVRLAPEGSFYRWMRARGRLGGQNKVPRVVDEEMARGILGS